MLARGREKKLRELCTSKSHNTCFVETVLIQTWILRILLLLANQQTIHWWETLQTKLIGDRGPFNPIRHFSASSNHGFHLPSPAHEDDVENDGDDANNDDNDDASFSENDAISSSKDEDSHNPERAYNFNRALGEHEPSTKTTQVEHGNQTNTLQNKEEINGD